MQTETRYRAYAKINLGLLVQAMRADGYHDIETVFHRVDLFDELTFETSDSIIVESSSPDAPGGEANICHAAARLLRESSGNSSGVRIRLTKNIPVGAGLGGGSSDAATVLLRLPGFWGVSIDTTHIHSLAVALGSDVPYFLRPGSALGRGRGEILEHFQLDLPYFILLCTPRVHVSTRWAYKHVHPRRRAADLRRILTEGIHDPAALAGALVNDFEEPVFRAYREVARAKSLIAGEGALFASMSGSGSSVYGFFDSSADAEGARRVLAEAGYRSHITAPHFAV